MRRAYVFAVSALAAFAVALMVQRDMGADYRASAKLTTEDTEGQPTQTIEKEARGLEQALASSEILRAAAVDAGLSLTEDAPNEDSSAMTIAVIRKQLSVERSKVVDGVASVTIAFSGTEPSASIRLVNALAQQALQARARGGQSSPSNQHAVVAAEQAAAAATQDLADARRKRDAFAAANKQLLTAPLTDIAAAEPSQDAGDAHREADAAARQRVRQLDSRLEELQTVRKQLLATMTPEHPHYQLVRDQIAQLQSEIDDANRSLLPPKTQGRALAAQQAQAALRQQARQQEALLEELAILERSVLLKKSRQEALASEAASVRQQALAALARPAWRIHAAEVARRIPRPTSLPSVLVAMAIGIVAGSATLLVGGAVRTIDSAADVETLLNVRLLGSLPDKGDAGAGGARVGHRSSRWLLLLSEATLALFLGAMVLVALMNHDFAAQILADPLAGLAESVRRLPAAFGGPVL